MSTPEQPTPPLTRKQMRELRNTAATPIITSNEPPAEPPVVATPLPRPATPAEVPPAPEPDASVDLDAHPLTRRQARQQERIRTASVPVITADLLAAQAAEQAERDAEAPVEPTDEQTSTDAADEQTDATPTDADGAAPAESESSASDTDTDTDIESTETEAAPREQDEHEDDVAGDERGFDAAGDERADEPEVEAAQVIDASAERPVVNSALGADLLAGDADAIELPASFDNILARGAGGTGSLSTSNALILSQTPASGPLVGPVTATGEVLITGTFALPEGLGSKGHAPGVADGKDVDAVLVDGELPAASSPTPIAASAAVSTSKSAGEIIQPPAPEKGGRLMMALAITAGALALALVGVLVFAITTGVFS